jgi:hypothetical protein
MNLPEEYADTTINAIDRSAAAADRGPSGILSLAAHGIEALACGLLCVASTIDAAHREMQAWRAQAEGERAKET